MGRLHSVWNQAEVEMFNIFRVQSDVCSRARVREYGDIRMAYEGGGSQYRLGAHGVGEWN
jgi:hypothetical protein